jgi:hypothetical protein
MRCEDVRENSRSGRVVDSGLRRLPIRWPPVPAGRLVAAEHPQRAEREQQNGQQAGTDQRSPGDRADLAKAAAEARTRVSR